MTRHELVEATTYFDRIVEAEFSPEVEKDFDAAKVLQIITEAINHPKLDKLLKHLVGIKLDAKIIELRFRYPVIDTLATIKPHPDAIPEDVLRQSTQFIFYLVAKIDAVYPLESVPFPPNFRLFLSLPDEID
jgi:hypothetical protein